MSSGGTSPSGDRRALADLRVSYDAGQLSVDDLTGNPLRQFLRWLQEARAAGVAEVNAMILGTVDTDGQPSARTVLLKGVDERGFTFYTNLESRKGAELAATGRASLVFPWYPMHRQVVVIGAAELVPRDEVDAYFATRPRDSQLGAWTSRQSAVIDSRSVLDTRFAQLEERFPEGTAIPTPQFWGGWLVRPLTVEFWQGRTSRLHDRLRFRSLAQRADLGHDAHWTVERLSP